NSLSSDTPANMQFAVSTTTVTWTVSDTTNNLFPYTPIFRSSDDEKPSITCPAAVTQTADAGKCYATVASLGSPTTADNCAVNGASLSNDAPASMQFAVGATTVTWTISDIHGNSATCTQTVTVTDEEKPSITCPAAVTQTADAGKCYATGAILDRPRTADNCAVDVARLSNDAPGQLQVAMTTATGTGTS